MTASRTCRACGADLPADVPWCLRCFEPVRHLSPREAPIPTVHVVRPREELPRSRWKGGPTTFGPVGRLTITALVILLAPVGGGAIGALVFWPAYLVMAVLVLRETWKSGVVETTSVRELAAAGPRAAPVSRRGPMPRSTIIAWTVLAVLAAILSAAWIGSDRQAPGVIGIVASVTALVMAVRWLLRD